MQKSGHMPQDRILIQEALHKVSEGPEAFMAWARQQPIDNKFMNLLGRMVEYTQKHGKNELHKTFAFLQSCFQKVWNLCELTGMIAVGPENFREMWSKASDYLQRGKPKEAAMLWEGIALFLVAQPNVQYQGMVDANLGIAYAQLKQFDRAVVCLQKALQQSTLSPVEREKVCANMGTVYRDMGDGSKSLESYQQALELAKERHDVAMQIVHWQNLALIRLDRGELAQARTYQEEACSLAKTVGNERLYQDALTRLALLTGMQGDKMRCKELCELALQVAPQVKDNAAPKS
jgi:tetratricopeptide (TPR) repeat protein